MKLTGHFWVYPIVYFSGLVLVVAGWPYGKWKWPLEYVLTTTSSKREQPCVRATGHGEHARECRDAPLLSYVEIKLASMNRVLLERYTLMIVFPCADEIFLSSYEILQNWLNNSGVISSLKIWQR